MVCSDYCVEELSRTDWWHWWCTLNERYLSRLLPTLVECCFDNFFHQVLEHNVFCKKFPKLETPACPSTQKISPFFQSTFLSTSIPVPLNPVWWLSTELYISKQHCLWVYTPSHLCYTWLFFHLKHLKINSLRHRVHF